MLRETLPILLLEQQPLLAQLLQIVSRASIGRGASRTLLLLGKRELHPLRVFAFAVWANIRKPVTSHGIFILRAAVIRLLLEVLVPDE